MSKEKRKYNAEVAASPSLRLQQAAPLGEKHPDQTDKKVAKRQFFSPELIARLAERIKKL